MFEKITPEMAGISSRNIRKYIEGLENARLSTHSIVMLRHGKIFYEGYWAPFNESFQHRMYSVTKSFVAIAIGFMEQDGLISLDDKIADHFPKEITENAAERVKSQTIRNMLMMSTAFPPQADGWFSRRTQDRLKLYFDDSSIPNGVNKIPGTIFEYDSCGSFVMGCLVKQKTGKTFVEYLREKLFDKIGVSENLYCLECPGGHLWADSAIMCTSRDLARVMQFTMNLGNWNGEQILNREYLEAATSNLIDTNRGNFGPSSYGYGYQIWRTRENSFFFNGMGSQYAIAVPDKDIVFVINSDNQGIDTSISTIIDTFYEIIVHNVSDEPLAEDKAAYDDLSAFSSRLKLFSLSGSCESAMQGRINGKVFKLNENPMGITEFKFSFDGDEGVMEYKNAQGDKKLGFGINKNVFGKFPQEGYSDAVGSVFAQGNYYDCACSAVWTQNERLEIAVQVIDKYFGRLTMRFAFPDENTVSVSMSKVAEDFMDEYCGYADGTAE